MAVNITTPNTIVISISVQSRLDIDSAERHEAKGHQADYDEGDAEAAQRRGHVGVPQPLADGLGLVDLRRRVGDRLGLILFGDRAYLQAPLTLDRKTVKTLLHESVIGLAGKKTAIGDAVGLAVKRLRNEPEGNRVLILLTDGSNTAGSIDPLKAADLAAQEKIKIYTIGVGADSRMVRDIFGSRRMATADIDEETLQAISEKTGGQYFRARDIESLMQIYSLLDEVEPIVEDSEVYRPVNELYYWPLSIALLLSLLVAVISAMPFRSLLRFSSRSEGARHA